MAKSPYFPREDSSIPREETLHETNAIAHFSLILSDLPDQEITQTIFSQRLPLLQRMLKTTVLNFYYIRQPEKSLRKTIQTFPTNKKKKT